MNKHAFKLLGLIILLSTLIMCGCNKKNKNIYEDAVAIEEQNNVRKDAVPVENLKNVPQDAVRGDFDGDGKIDNVWVDAEFLDDYAITPLRLKSDNPVLNGLTWQKGLMGVTLVNLGDLNGSNRDFLGAIPYGMSTWCNFETYAFKDGTWREVIDRFLIWEGDENHQRVYRGDNPGTVYILYNNLDGEDFDTHQKQVTLKF